MHDRVIITISAFVNIPTRNNTVRIHGLHEDEKQMENELSVRDNGNFCF